MTGAHKKLMGLVATATAIVGLATAVLTLRDQLSGREDDPGPVPTAVAAGGQLTSTNVAKLSDEVQLSRFEELLGPPTDRKRLQNDEWVATAWESPDMAVQAFSDRDSQVVAYTVTSLAPDYTPLVDYMPGGIRLRESTFADSPMEPSGSDGLFPASAKWSYHELHRGGGATAGRSVILAASFAANADDRAATHLLDLADCLPLSMFEYTAGCPPERLEPLREGLRVTSMTIGETTALEALSGDGALFHPTDDVGA